MVCLAPRALKDLLVVRPLNFVVGRMSAFAAALQRSLP